ncbi:hypothetical protein NP233_g4028 [Leucocoprinus birnbaumii]|uniref:Uncharacterized protein n=1 Tax=Leucocoprinus birnbaumii TaxID=56174 RepID=A0AAD5VZ74_9AGAR|nr:hypothetical protein NP233_g4028 [Leucocoprinus birnbaumii]
MQPGKGEISATRTIQGMFKPEPKYMDGFYYPDIGYEIYDFSVNRFKDIHSEASYTVHVENGQKYWVLKRRDIGIKDCPGIDRFIDLQQHTRALREWVETTYHPGYGQTSRGSSVGSNSDDSEVDEQPGIAMLGKRMRGFSVSVENVDLAIHSSADQNDLNLGQVGAETVTNFVDEGKGTTKGPDIQVDIEEEVEFTRKSRGLGLDSILYHRLWAR